MTTRVSLVLFLGSLLLIPSLWAEDPPEPNIETIVAAASRDIAEGRPGPAGISIVKALRSAPADSAASASDFMEAVYLLAFDVTFLLDWPERIEILEELLRDGDYSSDQLLLAGAKSTMGLSGEEAKTVLESLANFTTSPNRSLACAALFFLSSPYYFGWHECRPENLRRLAQDYAESSLGKSAIRLAIYNNIGKALEAGTGLTPLLRETPFDNVAALSQYDPPLGAALSALHEPTVGSITPEILAAWSTMLTQASTDDERCALLGLLRPYRLKPDTRTFLEPVYRSIVEKQDVSVPREFCREILLDYALIDTDLDSVRYWVNALLDPARLPAPPEESIYESHLKAAQCAADALAKAGRYEDALQIYTRLAEKYPSSMLAQQCASKSAEMQAKIDARNGGGTHPPTP